MNIGRIVGRAVSTQKDDMLVGTTLLLVEDLDTAGAGTGEVAVAADTLGAGVGDVVLVTQGSAARFTSVTRDRPVDALVVGIVDAIRLDGAEAFSREHGFARARARRAPATASGRKST
jgi:microcompartment protein CcmK/EutM